MRRRLPGVESKGVLTLGEWGSNMLNRLRCAAFVIATILLGVDSGMASAQEIFVANSLNNSVTAYTRTANGIVAPLRTIVGAATGLSSPFSVAVDTVNKELFVGNSTNSITVYALGATGNVAPVRTLIGAATGLNSPLQIAVDPVNNELVAANNFSPGTVTAYSRTASGNAAPIRTLSGAVTGLLFPISVTVDSVNNELYVANNNGSTSASSITVYTRTANGNTAPLRTIGGSSTGIVNPDGTALDLVNNELLVGDCNSYVSAFTRTANGNVAPLRTIVGAATGLNCAIGVSVDTVNNELEVASYFTNSVNAYARTANGNVAPLRSIAGAATGLSGPGFLAVAAQELCGTGMYPFPYTDVSAVGAAFCPGIMEAYVTGVSKGTTPTTFSPNDTVSRLQMTTFLQRSLDQGLTRASPRAALNQWWTPQSTASMQTITVGGNAVSCAADGKDIWISTGGSVVQVQASTGTPLGTWTGATNSAAVVVAGGKAFVTGLTGPANLYVIDPTQPPGAVTVAASKLGNNPEGIAFDGTNLWTANISGSVSIITPQATTPYPVTTVTTGFVNPVGILYDGTHIWVTDTNADTLLKLDATGAIIQTLAVGNGPGSPVFDGANIWVPNSVSNSITVVQAGSGNVVATIGADANNKLNRPTAASFDGERVLVTNQLGDSVSVFNAADLSLIANVTTGASTLPNGPCSDGVNFWVPLQNTGNLLRF
jgi:YVTN family beta-propeller protein